MAPPIVTPILLVSASSRVGGVAGAVAGEIRQRGTATLRAIGAGAVNQAVKAVALASRWLEAEGTPICVAPEFRELLLDGSRWTAITFTVEPRPPRSEVHP